MLSDTEHAMLILILLRIIQGNVLNSPNTHLNMLLQKKRSTNEGAILIRFSFVKKMEEFHYVINRIV